jgi:hypothetical protein
MKTILKITVAILLILAIIVGIAMLSIKIVPALFIAHLAKDLVVSAGFDTYTASYTTIGLFFLSMATLWSLFKWRHIKAIFLLLSIIIAGYCIGKIYFHNYIGKVSAPDSVKWFNPLDGSPNLYYSKDSTNEFSFFNRSGFNPQTGEKLLPVSSKTYKEYKAIRKANEERLAEEKLKKEQLEREEKLKGEQAENDEKLKEKSKQLEAEKERAAKLQTFIDYEIQRRNNNISLSPSKVGASADNLSTTNLISVLTLTFDGEKNISTPILDNGGEYFFRVSGLFAPSVQDIGHWSDAAFNTHNDTTLDNLHIPDYWWTWNGKSGHQRSVVEGDTISYRPAPNVYQPNHIYYFYFLGRGQSETIGSGDLQWFPNKGQLTFELYQIIRVSSSQSKQITKVSNKNNEYTIKYDDLKSEYNTLTNWENVSNYDTQVKMVSRLGEIRYEMVHLDSPNKAGVGSVKKQLVAKSSLPIHTVYGQQYRMNQSYNQTMDQEVAFQLLFEHAEAIYGQNAHIEINASSCPPTYYHVTVWTDNDTHNYVYVAKVNRPEHFFRRRDFQLKITEWELSSSS